jgi:hypothetical protein
VPISSSDGVPKEVECPADSPRVATFELLQGAQSLLHVVIHLHVGGVIHLLDTVRDLHQRRS